MLHIKLKPHVIFGIHTGTMEHQISHRDANNIKMFLGLKINDNMTKKTDLSSYGISEISIEEAQYSYTDKNTGKRMLRKKIRCCVRVNFLRVLGSGEYGIMEYTTSNMKKVITRVSKSLDKIGLVDENADFGTWKVTRFDSAFEIKEPLSDLLMAEMSRMVNIAADKRKGIKKNNIPGADTNTIERESLRFGNDSYTWNIYDKAKELENKFSKRKANGTPITQLQEAEAQALNGVIRLERQNHKGAVKVLLPNGTVSDLALPEVREKVLNTMADEIELFFGKDDLKVDPDLEKEFGISEITGIYDRIVDKSIQKKPKHPYHQYPICRYIPSRKRFQANITIYDCKSVIDGEERARETITGKTLEECEQKVYARLKETIEANKIIMDNSEPYESDEMPNLTCYEWDDPEEIAFLRKQYMTEKKAKDYLKDFLEHTKTLSVNGEDSTQQKQILSISDKDSKQKPQTSSVAEIVSSQRKYDWNSFENQEFSCERLFKNLEAE